MTSLPLDIVKEIARYDLVMQFSLYPAVKLDYTYKTAYGMIQHGFTDLFEELFPRFELTFEEWEDCFELAFVYRDMECVKLILSKMNGWSESVERALLMCRWNEKELFIR